MSSINVHKISKPFDLICEDIASDKSISHRCAIFSLLSNKPSKIKNFLKAEDTLNSLNIAKQLGADIKISDDEITIMPPDRITEPKDILDCGNAGTGMRLYTGLLASQEGSFILTGDKYLKSRPMKRVVEPLRSIGAQIDGRDNGNLAPLCIRGKQLKPFRYDSPIDSAQVKSALILSALQSSGKSYYKEALLSRDHTERMLRGMGVDIQANDDGWIEIEPPASALKPLDITVPADPSSGFFFAVAAAIVPGSTTTLKNISLNPTRIEAYKVLGQMGIEVEYILKDDRYEPIGDIIITSTQRPKAVKVDSNIAWLIDELPALSIVMAAAEGTSVVKNAKELRVKESDRITSVLTGLDKLGIKCIEHSDGYEITGGKLSQSATIDSFGDHRVAMSFAIAGLLSDIKIEDTECIETSFPNFTNILQQITKVENGD